MPSGSCGTGPEFRNPLEDEQQSSRMCLRTGWWEEAAFGTHQICFQLAHMSAGLRWLVVGLLEPRRRLREPIRLVFSASL